ncbi:TPA: hypothetical protein J1389_003629 [Escherichia coli]|nr:hypothetical protein [Escherichia coli]HBA9582275.1 hypothetical protein [Escherichia coli]HBA9586473.1 hypothetical protein [Escherichia coli]
MKQMSLIEMDGFLKGKCIPRDLKINETNAEYLVRKFGELEAKYAALATENAALREVVERMINQFAMSGISPEEKSINPAASLMFDAKSALSMPATDAFTAEIRVEARNEGINYTASRLAAAFNHGFINKSLREVFDVTRMILSAKEELANEPHPIDGLSGEYAEKSLEEWAEQIRKGGNQ